MTGLPNGRQVAGALAVLCFGVAITTVVFSEFAGFLLLSERVLNTLQLLAYLLPAAGLWLVGAVVWVTWKRSKVDGSADRFTEDRPRQRAQDVAQVGENLERRLENAAADWYRCEESYSVADVRERLEESAARAVKASTGFDDERAQAALDAGTWTDDPVAAAFLSPRRGQPLVERLRGALDPGQAFHRRVDRTVAAIEALEDGTANADEGNTGSTRPTETGARATGEVLAE